MDILTALPTMGGTAAAVVVGILVSLELYKKFKSITSETKGLDAQTEIVNLLREELERRHQINVALEEKVDELKGYCNKLEGTLRRIEVQLEECERHRRVSQGEE